MNNNNSVKTKVCMIVQDPMVKGGIAAVISGYYGSRLESDYDITYIESYQDGSKFQKLLKALKAYKAFHKLLKDNPPDLVHVHSSFGPSFFRKYPIINAAYKHGIPIVNHIHGSALKELYTDAPKWKRRMVESSYNKCTRLIVLSEEWKKKLSVIVPAEKIEVLSNYCKLYENTISKESMDLRFSKKQVLYLGRFDNLKGVIDIPDIARIAKEKVPGITFILAGSGETEPVTEKIKALQLEDTVILPGWIRGEEKEKLLKESAIFLLPSHMEAMPMSILEAMGYALPIVSTEVGGIPQVVQKDYNGRLLQPTDSKAMAEAIIGYLTDRESWEKASNASFEISKKKYSFEAHIEKLEAIYESVL